MYQQKQLKKQVFNILDQNAKMLIENLNFSNRLILKELKNRFNRKVHPLNFVVSIANGITTFTLLGTSKNFPFNYFLENIILRNETNQLAGIRFEVNGKIYPSENYNVSASADYTPNSSDGLVASTTVSCYPFNLFIEKPFDLKIYGVNTHTATQKVYMTFLGYIINENEIKELKE